MEEDGKGWLIRIGVSRWMFVQVPAHLGSPGQRAIKQLLLLLLLVACIYAFCDFTDLSESSGTVLNNSH